MMSGHYQTKLIYLIMVFTNMDDKSIPLNPANKQAHLDIEKEIAKRKNGLFTMSIRINGKQIVDIIFREIWKTT